MKRGFLNTSKAKKARPLAPPAASPSGPEPLESLFEKLGPWTKVDMDSLKEPSIQLRKMPIGKVEKVALPEGWEQPPPEAYDPTNANHREQAKHRGVITYTTQPEVDTGAGGAKDSLTECVFYPGTKEALKKIPGYPKPLVHPEKPGAFRVGTVLGKGAGLFSTRPLTEGEHILTERPLLMAPAALQTRCPDSFTYEQYIQVTLDEMEKVLKLSVERMSPDDRAAFMDLKNSHKEDGSGPHLGIFRTNGLGISGLRPGVEKTVGMYSAIPKFISRLNHSCSPNTQPLFDKASLSYKLFAVRDIAAGEELTFQYTNVDKPAAQRAEDLKPYDFVCTCTACTADVPASDARRAAITTFTPNTLKWAVDPKLSDDWLLKQCHAQLARIEAEGLQHLSAAYDAKKAIMDIYLCLGDAQKASEWAVRVNRNKWREDDDDAILKTTHLFQSLEDPGNTAEFEANMMWRIRVGGGSATSNMFRQMASMAGPDRIKTLPGGVSLMMF
ncbi:hypothetical protein C8R46DRAFT_980026 [Mycena filopes]|nr:hypothetical protein C8R46DRAFT_980026 [Mycena filopes]